MRQFIVATVACLFLMPAVVDADDTAKCMIDEGLVSSLIGRVPHSETGPWRSSDFNLSTATLRVKKAVCRFYETGQHWLGLCEFVPEAVARCSAGASVIPPDVVDWAQICGDVVSVATSMLEHLCADI